MQQDLQALRALKEYQARQALPDQQVPSVQPDQWDPPERQGRKAVRDKLVQLDRKGWLDLLVLQERLDPRVSLVKRVGSDLQVQLVNKDRLDQLGLQVAQVLRDRPAQPV